ncbi:MAG TPA: hypothetical protein VL281_03730 [Mycobacteriales bacterium]|nr:hypothetical protein [Mycobacteriales bacterium]
MTRHGRPAPPSTTELRRGVLGVSVLNDLDIEPNRQGVRLTGSPRVFVSWVECRRALDGLHPETDAGRERLARWLQARRWVADRSRLELVERVRPVGLPHDHPLHPGAGWVRAQVLGDALDLGMGFVDLDPSDPDRVVLAPPPALDAAGMDAGVLWSHAREHLEQLGALAASRLGTDRRGTIRPLGDCDVVTLLGARTLRVAIAQAAGGMGTVVAPMLRRGWTQLALVDPAFGPAAWAATAPLERGFPRPLLVTRDELVLASPGGRPEDLALRETAVTSPWDRDVLYR